LSSFLGLLAILEIGLAPIFPAILSIFEELISFLGTELPVVVETLVAFLKKQTPDVPGDAGTLGFVGGCSRTRTHFTLPPTDAGRLVKIYRVF
jgi:hypothetical protein